MAAARINYFYVAPGAESSERELVTVRTLEVGEDPPHHSAGEIVRLVDERGDYPEERSFKVVKVRRTPEASVSGFAGPTFRQPKTTTST